jgi:hypothetical protein
VDQTNDAGRIMSFLDAELRNTNPESRYFGICYLALIVFFQAAGWGFAAYRALALVAMLLLVGTAALVSWRPNLAVARRIGSILPGCMLAASLAPIVDAWRSAAAGHRVRLLDSLIVACVIITVFLLTCVPRLRDRSAFRIAAVPVLLASLLIPLANLVSGLAVYKLGLVAATTAEAARVMWSGLNPYDVQIDSYGASIVHDMAYGGYKYLPGMSIVYGPLTLLTGARSIILTNAILYIAIAASVFCLSRRLAGKATYFPILLFLSASARRGGDRRRAHSFCPPGVFAVGPFVIPRGHPDRAQPVNEARSSALRGNAALAVKESGMVALRHGHRCRRVAGAALSCLVAPELHR